MGLHFFNRSNHRREDNEAVSYIFKYLFYQQLYIAAGYLLTTLLFPKLKAFDSLFQSTK